MVSSGVVPPSRRRVRVFNLDPMHREGLSGESTISVPWERLAPGPVGSRLEVVDFDPLNRCFYEPVDLDDPIVVAQDGLPVDERDPRMHQQMVYAVAARVLETFDRALGRRVTFHNGRLRLFPHAFYGVNAYHVAELNAILFGYFQAAESSDDIVAGQTVFACLSHDIVAHEVTHALTHRLKPFYRFRTNPDVQAWNEAIADIVAILLHFQLEGVLEHLVQQSRTDLTDSAPIVELAGQLGRGTARGEALRSALSDPASVDLTTSVEPYERASTLVAAVCRAFVWAYEDEVRRLVLIASQGTGILPAGNLGEELSSAVCEQTRALSERLLTICLRGIEYMPPTDPTFGDFLRAVVTADVELFPRSHSPLRARLVQEFHRYGIHADGIVSLSESAFLLTTPPDLPSLPIDDHRVVLDCADLTASTTAAPSAPQQRSPHSSRLVKGPMWARLLTAWGQENAASLGMFPDREVRARQFHTCVRFDEAGQPRIDVVAQFLQAVVTKDETGQPRTTWGGATVVADAGGRIRYVIAKPAPTPAAADGSPRAVPASALAQNTADLEPTVVASLEHI